MKPLHHLQVLLKVHFLLMLVATLGSGVTGHRCPKGQVEHPDGSSFRCCLPVSCDPDYHVTFCEVDGQNDNCTSCGDEHWLPKRTSSFNPQNCKPRRLSRDSCQEVPGMSAFDLYASLGRRRGPQKATDEEFKWCHCNPELAVFYYEPEVTILSASVCQPIQELCKAGQEPTLNGTCQPCPPNTFQAQNGVYKLCYQKKNCSAMGLKTVNPGSASREAECAKPPPSPTDAPVLPTQKKTSSTRPALPTTTTPSSTSTNTTDDKVRIGTVRNAGSESNTNIIIIAVVCSVVLLLVVCLILYLRHKRLIRGCACMDSERNAWGSSDHPEPSRDNDNTSDNSCCACADSCIASSSKSSSNGACSKSGASIASEEKQPLPMLEGYMNGKCLKGSPGELSLSEPFYSSIPVGEEPCMRANGNLASYTNLNGVRPTMLKQEDFYNYPNKVHLPSGDEDDDNNAVNKEWQAKRQHAGGKGREGDGCTETDPLLPNVENASSGVPASDVQPLRGILRNGNNNHRQEPRGRGGGGGEAGGGVPGNRPNLSMLLSEESSVSNNSSGGDSYQMQDLPHFSQLVSNTARSNPSSVRDEAPEQHVHELPKQLQQRLLHHQQLQQQQLQQEAPTLPTRLILAVPVTSSTQPQLNPSLVQMEELKPVIPLSPSPAVNSPTAAPPTGAANVTESKGRSGSPARINPSQQEEVRGRGGGREMVSQKVVDTSSDKSTEAGKVGSQEDSPDEQTFSKQTLPSGSPEGEDDEETAHKSIGGSSGLGESLDVSSLSEEGRRSRNQYRRSQSEVSRGASPSQPLPRSISSPEEKHRPFAVVKPMQSDQSLNNSHDQLTELAQQLDSARCQYPLHSLRPTPARRQVSQDSSDDPDLTRPKTPDRLSEDENEDNNNNDEDGTQDDSEDRT